MKPENKQENTSAKRLLAKIVEKTQNKPVQEQLVSAIVSLAEDIEDIEREMNFTTSKVASVYPVVEALNEKLKNITLKKGDPGNDGKDGKDGQDYVLTEKDKKEIASRITVPVVEKVVEKVETIREIPQITETIVKEVKEVEVLDEKKLPQYGIYYRDALELLPEGEKLTIDAIENLRKELDELKKMRSVSHGGGIVGRDIIKSYDLSPYLDGVTKTFNIPGTWYVVSVATSSFPGALRPTIDYTWTPQTITFTDQIEASTTLATGQTVILTLVTA